MTEKVGRYLIQRFIARGGMGAVYEALDPELNRSVALKILREDDASPGVVKRLHREAAIAAQLHHPNIVSIHEVGIADGVHFIAMEFVPGKTLSEILAERRMKRDELLRILEEVARAVAHAHENGIVHRDLKPGNVIVEGSGRVVLTDFGLARAEMFESRLTRSNALLGTPQYMSPEQVEGKSSVVDARTDVFALGVILYEMLAGRTPFTGENAAQLYSQILHSDPDRPGGVDRDLWVVCAKAMEKDPHRRYVDARSFADDLARFRKGEPIGARPPSHFYRIWKLLRRRRGIVAAAVVGILAAGVVAAVLVPRWLREKRERERLEREQEAELEAQREAGALWMEVVLAKQGFYQQGEDPARVRERLEESIARIDGFVARHPKRPVGYYIRARGRLSLDELESAEKDLGSAVGLAPGPSPADALLGRVKLDLYTRGIYAGSGKLQQRRQSVAWLLREAREALQRGRGVSSSMWGLPRTREDEVTEVVVRAITAYHVDSDMARAKAILESAQQRDPSEEYCLLLGAWAGDLNKSLEWQDLAIRRMPHCARAHYDRGATLEGRGEHAEAIRAFEEALRINPRMTIAHVGRGAVRYSSGDFDGAISDFDATLKLDPKSVWALYNRAKAREKKNDRDGAEADFSRAIEIDSGMMLAWASRGTLRFVKGNRDGAITDLNRALELDGEHAASYLNRGVLRLELGDRPGAMEDFDSAVKFDPNLREAYVHRGDLRRTLRDSSRAIEDYSKALDIRPDPVVLTSRGTLRAMGRDLAGARQDFDDAIQLDPNYPAAYLNRGLVRQVEGDVDGAIGDYSRSIELNPRIPEAYLNRGLARQRKGDKSAAKDFEKTLEIAPADWPHRDHAKRLLEEARRP